MSYFQETVTKGRYTLPLAVFCSLACWFAVYTFIPDLPKENTHPLEDWLNIYLPEWGRRALSMFFYFLIGHFLVQFNNTYLLIQRRASLQTSFFYLFVTACPVLHPDYMAGLATILVLFSMYSLFKCYQNPHPMAFVMNSFVFLSLASLLFPHLIVFIPVFLFRMWYIQNLSFRNFMAAVLGIVLPYWLLWCYSFLTDDMSIFFTPFQELVNFTPFSVENLYYPGWATVIYFLIVFTVSAVFCITNANIDKISTRIYLRFLIALVFFLFIYIFLQPGQSAFLLPVTLAGISILAAHYFVLSNSKASNLFFICTVLGLIILFGYNIWTLS